MNGKDYTKAHSNIIAMSVWNPSVLNVAQHPVSKSHVTVHRLKQEEVRRVDIGMINYNGGRTVQHDVPHQTRAPKRNPDVACPVCQGYLASHSSTMHDQKIHMLGGLMQPCGNVSHQVGTVDFGKT